MALLAVACDMRPPVQSGARRDGSPGIHCNPGNTLSATNHTIY